MPQTHLLVVDLETVPDSDILPAERDPEAFPKPIQHRIVTLGFLLARILPDGQRERYEVRRLGAAGLTARTEREIIAGFWHMIDRHRPRVVTWNGRGFDLPVLKQRSLVYGLQAHAWHRTDPRYGYDYRYESRWHCDLMDVLCDNGASARLGLNETAVAIGLPGKMEAASGSEVGAMLVAGDHDRINRYCEGDALITLLRFAQRRYRA